MSERVDRYRRRTARQELGIRWIAVPFGAVGILFLVHGVAHLRSWEGWNAMVTGLASVITAVGLFTYREWARWLGAFVFAIATAADLFLLVEGRVEYGLEEVLVMLWRLSLIFFLVSPSTGRLFARARGRPVEAGDGVE